MVQQLGLGAAFLLELITCAIAAAVLLYIALPTPPPAPHTGMAADMLAGLQFVLGTKTLRSVFTLQVCGYVAAASLQVLTLPLLLAFTDTRMMGTVLTVSGLGAMVGTGLAGALAKRVRRPARVVAILQLIQGVLMIFSGLQPSVILVLGVAFCFMLVVPTARACREAVWQALAPVDMQGRVLLLLQTLMQAMLPLSGAALGPLADLVFEPLMQEDGAGGHGMLGIVFGSGKGRGVGLLMAVLGVAYIGVASWGLCQRGLRELTLETTLAELKARKGEVKTAETAAGADEYSKKKEK